MLKKKLSTSLFAIITLFIAGFVSSCTSSDNPSMGIPDDMCVDFATFVSSNYKGSVFTLQKMKTRISSLSQLLSKSTLRNSSPAHV